MSCRGNIPGLSKPFKQIFSGIVKSTNIPGTPFICLIIFLCWSMAPLTISSGSSIFHLQLFPTGFVWCLQQNTHLLAHAKLGVASMHLAFKPQTSYKTLMATDYWGHIGNSRKCQKLMYRPATWEMNPTKTNAITNTLWDRKSKGAHHTHLSLLSISCKSGIEGFLWLIWFAGLAGCSLHRASNISQISPLFL